MGSLFGGGSNNLPAKDQLPLGMNSSRSASHQEGRVLPLLYGRQRVGCQFISDAFDIKTNAVSTGGKESTRAGTDYFASFAIAVGHGPFSKLHDLYLNGDPVFSSTTKLYAAHLSQSGNVATYQTRIAHGRTTGDTVNVYNVQQPEFNGQFTITVVSPTQFQYTIPGTSIPDETASAVQGKKIYCTVKLDPIVADGDSNEITIPDFGTGTIHWGTETQTADAYLSAVSGIQHPPYKGICYIVFHQLFLGFNQTNIQNVEVVVERTPAFPWQANAAYSNIDGDCNPAIIYADLLLNKRYGLGLAESDLNLDAISAAVTRFYNEGIGFSPLFTRPQDLRSQLADILSMVQSAPIIDNDGKFSIAIQRTDTIADLTIDESMLSDLPSFDPADWSSVITETFINYTDRDAGWITDFVTWKDNAGNFAKNRPEPQTLDKPFITQKSVAQALVNIAGQIGSLPTTTGTLHLLFDADLFNSLIPGTGFTLDLATRPNLFGKYHVLKRTWVDPSKPTFDIDIEIDRSYLHTQSYLPAPPVPHVTPEPVVPALAPVSQPQFAVFQLPAGLRQSDSTTLAVLLQRDESTTLSALILLGRNYVFSGIAPESFFNLSILKNFALRGLFTADFAAAEAYLTPDNALPNEATDDPFPLVENLLIELTGPDQMFLDVSDFDALANTVLLFAGSEIMSVAKAELTSAGQYSLTVIRGRFGTTIEDHTAGDVFWVIGRADLVQLVHPHFVAGNTARFKVAFDWQSASDVDAFDYEI